MPQPFTVDDLYLHRKIGGIHCVPGIDRALCTIAAIDREGDASRTHLWQFALDGSGGSMLGCSDGSDSSPRWSPSGDRFASCPRAAARPRSTCPPPTAARTGRSASSRRAS